MKIYKFNGQNYADRKHSHMVIYSPDDEAEYGKGWYIENQITWLDSQLYISQKQLLIAYARNKLRFGAV